MKTFAIGDIHGRYGALKEVLVKSKFNYDEDTLIILGDVVDGDDRVRQCVDELLKIKNRIFVLGNHDKWFLDWLNTGQTPWIWTQQGGQWTLKSYGYDINNVPETHKDFFRNALKFYADRETRLFVHGGLSNINKYAHEHTFVELSWDRSMIDKAKEQVIPNYKHIFVGHTTTQIIDKNCLNFRCKKCNYEWENHISEQCINCKSKNIFFSKGITKPLTFNNITLLDAGAGWDGRLCLYDINTEKYFLSKLQEPK